MSGHFMDLSKLQQRYIYERQETLQILRKQINQNPKQLIALIRNLNIDDIFVCEGIVQIFIVWGPQIQQLSKLTKKPRSFLLRYFRTLLEMQEWTSIQPEVSSYLHELPIATRNYLSRTIIQQLLLRKPQTASQIQNDIYQAMQACIENRCNNLTRNFLQKHSHLTKDHQEPNLQHHQHIKWGSHPIDVFIPRQEWQLSQLIAACTSFAQCSTILISLEIITDLKIDTT